MEQNYEQELQEIEEIEEEKKEGILKNTVSWIFSNIKFLLIPGYRIQELSYREFE